jgi:hypothetical protein
MEGSSEEEEEGSWDAQTQTDVVECAGCKALQRKLKAAVANSGGALNDDCLSRGRLQRELNSMKRKAEDDADLIAKLQAQLADLQGDLDKARRHADVQTVNNAAVPREVPTKDADTQTESAMWKRLAVVTMHAHSEEQLVPVEKKMIDDATQTEEPVVEKEEAPLQEERPKEKKEKGKKNKKKRGSSPMTKYKGSKAPMAVAKVSSSVCAYM